MLNLDQVKQFYPQPAAISERNMLREYLQYKILAIIFGSSYGQKFNFMGGTAIRVVYGNDRFSEDLDFNDSGISKEEFSGLTRTIKRKLVKEGLDVEIRNVCGDTFRCYLKIIGMLFEYGLSSHRDEKILIQIDTRREKFSLKPVFKIINKFGIFAEIRVNARDIILSQKIGAVLGRKRIMGRDLYDIVYLASQTAPDWLFLEKKFGISKKKDIKSLIKKRLSDYDLDKLAKDILPFVFDKDKLETVRKFNKWLEGWSL